MSSFRYKPYLEVRASVVEHVTVGIPGGDGAGEAVFPSNVIVADVRSFSSPLLTIAAIVCWCDKSSWG